MHDDSFMHTRVPNMFALLKTSLLAIDAAHRFDVAACSDDANMTQTSYS